MNNLKALLILICCITLTLAVNAKESGGGSGDKVNNPLNALNLEDGCVLVFADGIDKDQCEEVDSPSQSGQQFICSALYICERE